MSLQDPFHEGELAVQTRAGETHTALLNARMIGGAIIPGALPFIARQPWVILGGLDREERLWCSALVGAAGFAEASDDGATLSLDLARAPVHGANPLLREHSLGRATGALFIELETRRRLRVNGRIAEATADRLRLAVEESFPNCPKYIQKRSFDGGRVAPALEAESRNGAELGDEERARIQAADTLFIATLHPGRGVDVSHRGGAAGFVEVVDARTLRLPDYTGNGLFQSFGNLEVDPRLGMFIPDFSGPGLLHLTGTARVVFDAPDPEGRSGGTGRFLEFSVERWVSTPPGEGAPSWTLVEASPYNP